MSPRTTGPSSTSILLSWNQVDEYLNVSQSFSLIWIAFRWSGELRVRIKLKRKKILWGIISCIYADEIVRPSMAVAERWNWSSGRWEVRPTPRWNCGDGIIVINKWERKKLTPLNSKTKARRRSFLALYTCPSFSYLSIGLCLGLCLNNFFLLKIFFNHPDQWYRLLGIRLRKSTCNRILESLFWRWSAITHMISERSSHPVDLKLAQPVSSQESAGQKVCT